MQSSMRVFTENSAGVCATGIKVSEQARVPFLPRSSHLFLQILGVEKIFDYSLTHDLGGAIWVDGRQGTIFVDWNHIRLEGDVTIDRRRRRKKKSPDIVFCHAAKENNGTVDIFVVETKRLLGRHSDSLVNSSRQIFAAGGHICNLTFSPAR